MTIENNNEFYGFKRASNLDNTPIKPAASEDIPPKTKNIYTKNSSASIWTAVFFVVALVSILCFTTFRWNTSSNSDYAVVKSEIESKTLTEKKLKTNKSYTVPENDDLKENSLTNRVEKAAESYMSENYGDYEFISKEQDGNNYCLHYQIKEDTEFLAILTPITLSCNAYSEQTDIDFTSDLSDSVREWHLDGVWSYADDISNYYLKINRCDGDTLYVEYLFSDIANTNNLSNDSTNEEISLTIFSDNDEHYYTTEPVKIDIYPYGTTLEIGGDGAGINVYGIWLNKENEYNSL